MVDLRHCHIKKKKVGIKKKKGRYKEEKIKLDVGPTSLPIPGQKKKLVFMLEIGFYLKKNVQLSKSDM